MRHRPLQFSLAALFAVLTVVSLVLGYVRFVGLRGVVVALGPPLVIGGLAHAIITDPWNSSLPAHRDEEWKPPAPSATKALLSLVLGFLAWLPVLVLMNWR